MFAEEEGKISEEQLTSYLEELEKNKRSPKLSEGRKKIKVRTEVNKIETIKNNRKINITKYCF